MTRPEVVVFDVNETLSDLAALARRCDAVGAAPGTFELWFAGVLRDGISLSAAGAFAPFGQIGRHVLRVLLRAQGVADPGAAADHVLAGFDELRLHPDVPDGLRRLHAAGVRLVTLTNGSAALTEGLLSRGGVRDLVEHVLDVEAPRRWKPAPEPYHYAARVAGVAPDRAAMVAVHAWDVDGALRAGLVGAYLDRSAHGSNALSGPSGSNGPSASSGPGGSGGPSGPSGSDYPAYLRPPTVVAATLGELAEALLAL